MNRNKGEIQQSVIPQESRDVSLVAVEEDVVPWNHAKEFAVLLALCSQYYSQLLMIVGAGVYARDIAAVIGGESIVSWPAIAINILTAATIPPIARAADLWGRKWFLVIPTSFGFVGSLIIARAETMQTAIAGFVLAGVSFGAQPLVHGVASETMPRKYRSFAQGACNAAIALGGVTALLSGGALTNNNSTGFRKYWYICAGVYALSTIMLATLYNPPPREEQLRMSFEEKMRHLDWIGFALYIAGLVLFCLGLSYSDNPFTWSDPHVNAPFAIGVVIIFILIGYEWKVKKDGLFHHGLFIHRNFLIALVAVFIEGCVFTAANIYFPFSMSIINTGIQTFTVLTCFSTAFCCLLVMSVVVGFIIFKTKRIRPAAMFSNTSFLIFGAVMASVTSTTPAGLFWFYVLFFGFGLGSGVISLYTTAQLATPPELIAITSGLMGSIRSTGGSVAVPIYAALFNSALQKNLFPKVAAAVIPLGVSEADVRSLITDLSSGAIESALKIPGVTLEVIGAAGAALKSAYVIGFRSVFICAASFAAFAVIITAFLIDPKLEFNAKIDAPLDRVEGNASESEVEGGKHVELMTVRE